MADSILTPEREAEALRLADLIGPKAREEVSRMARIPASKPDAPPLGAAEFEIRDRAHALAAHAIETAVNGRKKGGIGGRA
jgi:glycine cleavage system aminomethyltransferase T